MARNKLDDNEIQQRLQDLPGWSYQNNKLHREYDFSSFVEAFGFMSQVALLAEKMNHHPELYNVYNRVTIDLNTHDVGGVTNKDFELALDMESVRPPLAS